jgi:hypothetical protein
MVICRRLRRPKAWTRIVVPLASSYSERCCHVVWDRNCEPWECAGRITRHSERGPFRSEPAGLTMHNGLHPGIRPPLERDAEPDFSPLAVQKWPFWEMSKTSDRQHPPPLRPERYHLIRTQPCEPLGGLRLGVCPICYPVGRRQFGNDPVLLQCLGQLGAVKGVTLCPLQQGDRRPGGDPASGCTLLSASTKLWARSTG